MGWSTRSSRRSVFSVSEARSRKLADRNFSPPAEPTERCWVPVGADAAAGSSAEDERRVDVSSPEVEHWLAVASAAVALAAGIEAVDSGMAAAAVVGVVGVVEVVVDVDVVAAAAVVVGVVAAVVAVEDVGAADLAERVRTAAEMFPAVRTVRAAASNRSSPDDEAVRLLGCDHDCCRLCCSRCCHYRCCCCCSR